MQINKLTLSTSRRKIAYLREGDPNKPKLLFIHGNASSSVFFLPIMQQLKDDFDMIAPDLNGYGDTEPSPVKASSGLYDWAEDIDAFVEALNIDSFVLCGWSLGGGVAMKYTLLHGGKVKKLVLICPMSPYGFGGTKGTDGQMYDQRGWGCAGGFANTAFVDLLNQKDRSDAPNTARDVIRRSLFKNGFPLSSEWEDVFVDELLKMQVGEDYYPGDYAPLSSFPYVLPGERGFNNTLAPQYADVSAIAELENKPEIIWLRGDSDTLVSNNSLSDLAVLGKLGFVPGYVGDEVFPPQPMIDQTRAVLERYRQNGGSYSEHLIENCAHSVHLEQPEQFISILKESLL